MLCGLHIRIWNLAQHMKKQNKNTKMLDLLMENWKLRVWCSLLIFFSCDMQDFKLLYVNHWAFGASFLYWVDFKMTKLMSYGPHHTLFPIYIMSGSSYVQIEIGKSKSGMNKRKKNVIHKTLLGLRLKTQLKSNYDWKEFSRFQSSRGKKTKRLYILRRLQKYD